MKNKLIVILVLIVFVLIGIFVLFYNTERELYDISKSEENLTNIVIIKNNDIKNENLIDEFIEKAIFSNVENQEINIIQDDKKIKLKYTSGEYAKAKESAKDEDNFTVPISDGSFTNNKRVYGYYSLIINEEPQGEYPLGSNYIKRIIENDTVILYFDAPFIEYTTRPEICKYSLDSSNYSKKFDLKYMQRKNLGIKSIYNAGEYEIKTFGGDVIITVEDGVTYTLEDALNKGVITPDDILTQTKMDLKYGICQDSFYSDGGSVEYCYYGEQNNQYTILKLNTLNNDKDLIIGMGGHIINSYNKNNK